MHAGDAFVSPAEGPCHPMPANVQRALAANPMGIDPPAVAWLNDFGAWCDPVQRRDGPHHAQTRHRRRRADQRRRERDARRVVLHAMLFEIDTHPILCKGLHICRFITDHSPLFLAMRAPRQGPRARTISRLRHGDLVPEAGLAWSQRHALHWAAPLPLAINPHPPVDAKAPVPTQPGERCHERRICAPTSRRQDDGTLDGKQLSNPLQHIVVDGLGHTATGLFEDLPHQRHGAATRDERHAHHTGGMPQG